LKNNLLEHFANAEQQTDGRNVVIVFKDAMRTLIKEALLIRNCDADALLFSKVADLIRRDIFDHEGSRPSLSFDIGCQSRSVPVTLKTLISMILNGSNVTEQEKTESQACLTICQTVVFNAKKSARASKHTRHTLAREPPLALYLGLDIRATTRSKKLIDHLNHLGLPVSYKRVIEVEDSLAQSVCEQFQEDGVVCPKNVLSGLFTVAAIDNVDHNPSSSTSTGSLHGTTISLFQFPTIIDQGEIRTSDRDIHTSCNTIELPDNYSFVPTVLLNHKDITVSARTAEKPAANCLSENFDKESNWIKQALVILDQDDLTADDKLGWSAYHASFNVDNIAAICSLMPLFYEKAASPSMIKHEMDVVNAAIQLVNHGQIPVIACDQPLFAIAKYVQWQWPDQYGEDMNVVMLGGLHIEMAL